MDWEEWYDKNKPAFEEDNNEFIEHHCRFLNRRLVTKVAKRDRGPWIFVASHPQLCRGRVTMLEDQSL